MLLLGGRGPRCLALVSHLFPERPPLPAQHRAWLPSGLLSTGCSQPLARAWNRHPIVEYCGVLKLMPKVHVERPRSAGLCPPPSRRLPHCAQRAVPAPWGGRGCSGHGPGPGPVRGTQRGGKSGFPLTKPVFSLRVTEASGPYTWPCCRPKEGWASGRWFPHRPPSSLLLASVTGPDAPGCATHTSSCCLLFPSQHSGFQ